MKDYTDLSVVELTNILESRYLPTDGVKDSLVSRLEADDAVNNPSPSPELHLSPVVPAAQIHKPTPTSIPNHLPNELDEEYCLNWDDDGDIDDDTPTASTVTEPAEPEKATEATLKAIRDSSPEIKSDPNAGTTEESSSESVKEASSAPPSFERVTKSGYKYKSIAATYFSDPPNSITKPLSAMTPSIIKTSSNTPPNSVTNVTTNSHSASPTTPPKISPTPPPSAPANALSRAPAPPTSNGNITAIPSAAPITAPIVATTPSIAVSKAPAITDNSTSTTTSIATSAQKITIPNALADASCVRTTKSGYKFNSIASLFPSLAGVAAAAPVNSPIALAKPQPIANVVIDTQSTYAVEVKLTTEEEDARKLAVRASRFGIIAQEPETAALEGGKQDRPVQTENSDEKAMKERESKLEVERENERERIRQRVTTTKRQRNDDDDDKRAENQHRYNRQSRYRTPHYRAPHSNPRAYYGPRRRY